MRLHRDLSLDCLHIDKWGEKWYYMYNLVYLNRRFSVLLCGEKRYKITVIKPS